MKIVLNIQVKSGWRGCHLYQCSISLSENRSLALVNTNIQTRKNGGSKCVTKKPQRK